MPVIMDNHGADLAQKRIEDALQRIEAASMRRIEPIAPDQRLAELKDRHASLRSDMEQAVVELNGLIEGKP